jgi:predicted kinase
MVSRGLAVNGELADIARALVRFHADAARGRHISSHATASSLGTRWKDLLSELERLGGNVVARDLIERVGRLASEYIGGRMVLFTQRIIDGHIVNGHGGLLAADVYCMPDGPVFADRLERDDRSRYVDCIDDAACLAMDLVFLGRKDLADYFLDCYRQHSQDGAPASLADFYTAYRAVLQAKADCERFSNGERDAGADASRHLWLAAQHLTSGAVRLALIGGAPGTGRTKLARSLAERVGAEVISVDEVRQELEESNSISAENDVRGDGWCAAHSAAAVHDIALRRAHTRLANGQSVIIDGTWCDPSERRLARQLATETRAALLEIDCISGDPVKTEVVDGGEWDGPHRVDTRRGSSVPTDEAVQLWYRTV